MNYIAPLALCGLALSAPASADPLFYSSVTSNDLEYITAADPHVFNCVAFQGTSPQEMPDKRGGDLFGRAHVFEARFTDGTSLGIWVSTDVGSPDLARATALKIAPSIGRLPTFMRKNLNHVVIHSGDETAFAEDKGRFFVMYDRNIDRRISTHDIDETVFHESVHATLDVPHADSGAWKQARNSDQAFITGYAQDNPSGEDMAESALLAWAVIQHPGRLPRNIENHVQQTIPARLAYFEDLFQQADPVFQKIGPVKSCQ